MGMGCLAVTDGAVQKMLSVWDVVRGLGELVRLVGKDSNVSVQMCVCTAGHGAKLSLALPRTRLRKRDSAMSRKDCISRGNCLE